MNDILYYVLSSVLVLMVLAGIYLMSKVKLSSLGNRISALAMLGGIIVTLFYAKIITVPVLYIAMAIGLVAGLVFSSRVKMIQMPQMVALLNGLGGAASAIVGCFSLMGIGADINAFSLATSALAITVGMVTLTGSLVAAGKLHRILPQKPIVLKRHPIYTIGLLAAVLVLIVLSSIYSVSKDIMWVFVVTNLVVSGAFGVIFSIRVGGADMPITISLLNSLSGVAGAIAGLAINNLLLVAVGGIVGASGLLLTQIMCRAINRSLLDILLGTNTKARRQPKKEAGEAAEAQAKEEPENQKPAERSPSEILSGAKNVIIVPGYGMAIAQAQHLVKKLADKLIESGVKVKYAIHPVAGRMPGHMNVLLCEANVDYEDLYEMDDINGEFAAADATIVVGANDVLNPAAREAEGTPIYGMPILNVDKCKEIFIFNYDKKPGYAGVDNPIYSRKDGVHLYLGNAAETLQAFLAELNGEGSVKSAEEAPVADSPVKANPVSILKSAKNVIIVPGYGMAIAQAQHLVKKLADKLVENGARVKYAIHPVAGRMPGHMNVLLCEANVDYEDLYEMDDINGEFAAADATIVVGANDVLNPAAREAEGTPIYGMPILNVDKCKEIFIFNYDKKPGYAGVDNPIYSRKDGVHLFMGNAADTLQSVLVALDAAAPIPEAPAKEQKADPTEILRKAKNIIIVPGYGMAIAQAQHLVKKLADKLVENGAKVKYAIHPVAGRMPGHMNVLLCEANVDYEDLYEMAEINGEFASADAAIVVGANDVLNPAAREAEGTPIYGMPILNVDKCKEIFIFNYDTKPGYAGVDNPIYTRKEGVHLYLGNAADTLQSVIEKI